MNDIDKVIKGLECCSKCSGDYCRKCPYTDENEGSAPVCTVHLAADALALLKEQGTVEPKKTAYQRVDHTIAYRYRCGTCDMNIFSSYKYCPFCGQAVKWNES